MRKFFSVGIGKIKQQFTTLDKFSVDLYYQRGLYLKKMWKAGQLYRGYAGLMVIFYGLTFTFLISNWAWNDSRR